ncbi:probable replication factor C subunit 3 [Hydra vulgaris]|uniref:probable replication factor C subunit 3 n=1 Tax=Hydra vulgaris TaxID=6087 RepID=UPI0032EA55A5
MIEVNASTCRFIMWCDNLSNVIDPLKSRCICVRVPRPQSGELFAYLTYISLKKKFDPDMKSLIDIVNVSECNIKTSLRYLQSYIYGYDYKTNYDVAIDTMVKMIIKCEYDNMEVIRDTFFNIWITGFESIRIIRNILKKVICSDEISSEQCKANIVIRTSEIEHNILRGRHDIIHFDAFVISIMKLIQDYDIKNKTLPNTKKAIKIRTPIKNRTLTK